MNVAAVNVDAVNAVPMVGGPFAYGLGFVLLLVVVLGGDGWGRSLVTVAHEGGHWTMGALTFRKPGGISLRDGGGGGTEGETVGGAGRITA
ncbi:MAG: hypothetical protein ABS81_20195 [Pseudonocardia sp. SCN 72-86]|nr:MAG: hypothetical protein ABS81_20195 [Pseudonocardia sp. SCN 72-86]